ncbi:MAG: hypothetical protein HKP55_06745 [Gammaproteobacteria bacterium]|nr:hypothetical protein [Gammaproteobacteria bacterium]
MDYSQIYLISLGVVIVVAALYFFRKVIGDTFDRFLFRNDPESLALIKMAKEAKKKGAKTTPYPPSF